MRLLSKKNFFLFLLISGGFFLRISRLEELFNFSFDEEVIAFRVKQLIVNHRFFLIGGVTPFRVHLGPYFYYFSSLLMLFPLKLNPLSWGFWAAIISTFTIFLIYYVGKKLFNERVGLFASFLQAFSFYQILYDRHYWPLFLDPLISLLVLLSLWKIINQKLNWAVFLGLVLSFAWHTDPTTWPYFLLVALVFLIFRLPINNRKFILSVLIFLFSFLPLVLFDLRHEGSNIRGLLQFKDVAQKQAGFSAEEFKKSLLFIPHTLGKLLWNSKNEIIYYHRFSLKDQNFLSIISALLIFFFFYLTFKNKPLVKTKKNSISLVISLVFLVIFIGVVFYGNFISFDLWDHYLVILFPIFFLILGYFADKWWQSQWYIFLLLFLPLFAFANIKEFLLYKLPFNFKNKTEAVSWVAQELKNEDFALDSLSKNFRYNGIRYLFYLAGKEPNISFVDPALFWLYDEKPKEKYPKIFVVFVSQDFKKESEEMVRYQGFLKKASRKKNFNDIEVLIVDNENQEFTISF